MKKAIVFGVFGLIINSFVFAQNDNYKCIDNQKKEVPTYLLNNKILMGDLLYLYDSITINMISSMNVFEGNDIPMSIQNLGKYGIVGIKAPFQIETKTISEIKKWFNINDDSIKIAIDGFILDNDSILIATEAINEIKIVKNYREVLGINIWTLLPENRNGITTFKGDGKIHIR